MAPRDNLTRYLSALPEGMDSFAECRVKGNVLDEVLAWLAAVEGSPHPALEAALRTHRPLGRSLEWVPEVLINAVSLQIADAGYPSDQSWLDEVYRRQREAYRTPIYKALMLVLSPTLLTMGARDRWRAYRVGTELAIERWTKTPTGRVATATLHHPPALYSRLNVLSLGVAMVAAIDACGAENTQLELEEDAPEGQSRFRLSYRA